MKKTWIRVGWVVFWVTWPGIWLVIRLTPPRTRIVVVHQNKILLVKSWLGTGRWGLPGGGLHRNELARAGAARELLEETGIVVTPTDFQELGDFVVRVKGIKTRLVGFGVRLSTSPTLKLQKREITDARWCSQAEIENLAIDESARAVLAAFRQR